MRGLNALYMIRNILDMLTIAMGIWILFLFIHLYCWNVIIGLVYFGHQIILPIWIDLAMRLKNLKKSMQEMQ